MSLFAPFAFYSQFPTLITTLDIEYLVVGGGASGGNNYGGGGGAGGYRSGSVTLITNQTYPIIVGDGGFNVTGTNPGINGGTSKFFGIEGAGGGGGGRTQFSDALGAAFAGGSGGGGGGARRLTNNSGSGNVPNTTPVQGYGGGNGGSQATNGTGAGGGGALEVGGNGQNTAGGLAGRGGSGSLWLDGNRYAGGGGGCTFNTQAVPPLGGPGGGGKGTSSTPATSGSVNTGGGGGSNSNRGGSGIVKFRYPGTPNTNLVGGNISQSGGYTYHEFTSSQFLYFNAAEQQASDDAWEPTDFVGAKYYWRADLGTTLSGNNVTAWEDQISSFVLQNPSSSAQPYYSSSVSILNNQPAVCFNGTSQYLHTTGSPANMTGDVTMLYVCNVISGSAGGTIFGVCDFTGTPSFRMSHDTFGNWHRIVYNSGSSSTIATAYNVGGQSVASTVNVANHFLMQYKRSAGDMAFSSGSISQLIYDYGCEVNRTAWSTNSGFTTGATITNKGGAVFGSPARYVRVDMAEMLVVYGTVSDEDMVRWKNYVKNRYKIDIT